MRQCLGLVLDVAAEVGELGHVDHGKRAVGRVLAWGGSFAGRGRKKKKRGGHGKRKRIRMRTSMFGSAPGSENQETKTKKKRERERERERKGRQMGRQVRGWTGESYYRLKSAPRMRLFARPLSMKCPSFRHRLGLRLLRCFRPGTLLWQHHPYRHSLRPLLLLFLLELFRLLVVVVVGRLAGFRLPEMGPARAKLYKYTHARTSLLSVHAKKGAEREQCKGK